LLAVLADITHGKIEIVERHAKLRGVGVSGVHSTWQKFVAPLEEGVLENVLSAVDVYESRMSVQYDRMPRSLFTAGTADFLLSVSRHELDDGMSCGACYQARGKVQTCGHQSEQTQRQFEQSPDPSIGFVSVMAGVALVAELMKASDEQLRGAAVRNTVRLGMNVLSPTIRAKVFARSKDPRCNCGSEYVRLGYRKIWKP
jgi:hypothetical protein